jgi:transcriptional regulator with XRE-family HTH domain
VTKQRRRKPRDPEEAAAFKSMGQAIASKREQRGMTRAELAAEAEMTRTELEEIERGQIDEWWGGIRLLARAFDMRLDAFFAEVEEFGPEGEEWRRSAREAEQKRGE